MSAIAQRPRRPMGCAISAAAPSRWSDSSGCSVSGLLRYAYHVDTLQCAPGFTERRALRSEEHTSELQSRFDLVCRLLLAKKKLLDDAAVLTPPTPERQPSASDPAGLTR